jgi:threonine/homoserine/homoserine lactone efflux protein
MHLETWLAFALASAVMLVIPGPTILTVIGYSMGGVAAPDARTRAAIVAAVALGDCTALALSLAGLGGVLAASAFWFTVVKWIGGLYLLYLGLRMLASGLRPAQLLAEPASGSRRSLFAHTYMVTALNPKGIIFFVAFLPQFVHAGGDVAMQLWILAITFVALSTLNASLYAAFAGAARRLLASPKSQRGFNLAGGSLLSGAGLWALLAKRPG